MDKDCKDDGIDNFRKRLPSLALFHNAISFGQTSLVSTSTTRSEFFTCKERTFCKGLWIGDVMNLSVDMKQVKKEARAYDVN